VTTRLGTFKRGDDKTFRAVVVTVADAPVDLTGDEWTVRAQLRPHGKDDATFVELVIDPGPLAESRVVCSVPRDVSETMAPGRWQGDIEVTGPEGRQSSATFAVDVIADVTRG
jgi:hypothetical protein